MVFQVCRIALLRATISFCRQPMVNRSFHLLCCSLNQRYLCNFHAGGTSARQLHNSTFYWNSSQSSPLSGPLNPVEFERICKETLESLVEYFEEIAEEIPVLKNADITYSDGVITAYLGEEFGTYVINRQTPNQQIWLSSPTSGPKRYDFVSGTWVYKHDNTSLHSLLDREIGYLVKKSLKFSARSFGEELK